PSNGKSSRVSGQSGTTSSSGHNQDQSDRQGSVPDMPSTGVPLPDGLLLRPLRGVRYTVADLADVTSPPYDLISPDDLRNLLSLHPNNVARLILPGADRHRYGEARDTLRDWLATGVLTVDDLPALYVYEQSGHGHLQRGLIGNVGLAD